MTSLPSYDVIFCLRLPYPLKFRNSLFLDGFNLAEIWLRGQVLGADSESEVIFYIRGNIKPILAISCNFASEKETSTP